MPPGARVAGGEHRAAPACACPRLAGGACTCAPSRLDECGAVAIVPRARQHDRRPSPVGQLVDEARRGDGIDQDEPLTVVERIRRDLLRPALAPPCSGVQSGCDADQCQSPGASSCMRASLDDEIEMALR